MLIDRPRPSIADLSRSLHARIDRDGAIPWEQRVISQERGERSRNSCHRYSLKERRRYAKVRETGAYVPEMSARLENDLNLCDGARRLARKLSEIAYRQRHRTIPRITVSYLALALNVCDRSIQRHLRQLEAEGYIAVQVLQSGVRMCLGLAIDLLNTLFPRHLRSKWPARALESGVTILSDNKRFLIKHTPIPCQLWADRCREGVWRSLMSTLTPISVSN